MYKSKLLDLFKALTKRELGRLDIYIDAQKDLLKEDVLWLYNNVRHNYTNSTSPKLDRQYVIDKLYNHNDAKKAEADWRHLMTLLTKVIENFLVSLEINNEDLLPKVFLLRAYTNKGLDNMFEEEFAKLTKPPAKNTEYELHHLLHLFLIEEEMYNKKSLAQVAGVNKNIDVLLERLDLHYIVTKLRIMCDLYSGRNFLPSSVEKPWLLNEILTYVENQPTLIEHPLVSVYYRILVMQIEPTKERYDDFLNYLQTHEFNFTPTLLHDLYFYALNYCGQQINSGNIDYHKDMFDVYRKFYNEKNTYKIKVLIKEDFKNVVTVCIRLGEIAFAENFIAQYCKYLNAEDKDLALNAALGELNINKKKYNIALDYLYAIKTNDTFTMLNAKVAILKCYYEQQEWRLLDSSLNAASAFLRTNKKIPENNKWNYKVFFRILQKLLNIREDYKDRAKKSISKLKLEMEQQQLTVFVWLYQKVTELYNELHASSRKM